MLQDQNHPAACELLRILRANGLIGSERRGFEERVREALDIPNINMQQSVGTANMPSIHDEKDDDEPTAETVISEHYRVNRDHLVDVLHDLSGFADANFEEGVTDALTSLRHGNEKPRSISLQELLMEFAETGEAMGIPVEVMVAESLPNVIARRADLRAAITNLVANAKRAIGTRRVIHREIRIHAQQRGENVEITITDAAGGIDGEILNNMFTGTGRSAVGIAGGTGRGTQRVQSAIENMDGQVWVENIGIGETRGACFHIELPSAQLDFSFLEGVPEAPAEGGYVLIVEDHPTNRLILERMLTANGVAAAQIISAQNGREAEPPLREAVRTRNTLPFVVFMDEHLPGIQGIAIARRMRAANPRVRVVMCTADTSTGTLETYEEEGLEVLTKPVGMEAIRATIRHPREQQVLPSRPFRFII